MSIQYTIELTFASDEAVHTGNISDSIIDAIPSDVIWKLKVREVDDQSYTLTNDPQFAPQPE